jgi:hypothetical protein
VISKVSSALKPAGTFAIQEYFNWGAMSVRPHSEPHVRVVNACLESWKQSDGDINIGGRVTAMLQDCGMHVNHIAPLSRIGRPGSMEWNWVTTFMHSYIPRLIKMSLLTEEDYGEWQNEWSTLEMNPTAFCFCPQMVELIGVKT